MNTSFLKKLGVNKIHSGAFDGTWRKTKGQLHSVISPVNGKEVGKVRMATPADYAAISKKAHATYLKWRELPAPQRGEYVRQIGNAFRENKELLGKLVTLEAGKIVQEGLGEAQ
ncbi:MAG: aldehyde dehydrogenase family protein, partial [Planctomycetota bacterium]|nr:aldehyde dehydrogenase family protein [Planctomycetota bacterium]